MVRLRDGVSARGLDSDAAKHFVAKKQEGL
jgi:hypothetical protein